MRTSSPLAVRGGLIGVFAVLFAALVGPTAVAQLRPSPFPQTRPPGMGGAGVFGGGGGAGIGGGIGGMGGTGIGGMGGNRIGGAGRPTIVHSCGKCGAEMARNNSTIGHTGSCPGCGLHYMLGSARDDGRARPNPGAGMPGRIPGMPAMPGVPPGFEPGFPGGFAPGVPQPQPFVPQPQPQPFNPQPANPQPDQVFVAVNTPDPNPAFGNENELVHPPVTDPVPVTPPPETSSTPKPAAPKSGKTVYIIGGIVLALLVILGMVLGVLYVKASAKQQTRAGGRLPGRGRRVYD